MACLGSVCFEKEIFQNKHLNRETVSNEVMNSIQIARL